MTKNICIIGTSPLMTLIFYRLYKNCNITVYDYKDFIGGAWSNNYFGESCYPNFNNIIIPDNYSEDIAIDNINKELKKFKCKIDVPSVLAKPSYKYNAKNIYMHDFSNFYDLLKKKKVIIKERISKMLIEKNKVTLNNNSYDFLFLPSCFNIENIFLDIERIYLEYHNTKSSHISVDFDTKKLPLCTYDDNFDNIFDRAQIKKINEKFIFTGRVRKKFKSNQKDFLLKKSNFLKKYSDYIVDSKLIYYNHETIDQDKLKSFKKKLDKYPISLVETRQFNQGYLFLQESIEKCKKKFFC